jgi:hypothetical protein
LLDTEDLNGNGVLDEGEDINGNNVLDSEDLDRNGRLTEFSMFERTSPAIFEDRLLAPRCLDRGNLDADYLAEITGKFRAGETRLFPALNHLLALDLWQELYTDES